MKNLLAYISHEHQLGIEETIALKIQIDNSFSLGWKPEDILLVTNFPYSYRGINALVLGDENYCSFWPQASKINTIVNLFQLRLIQKAEIYWYHDLVAFQLHEITKEELGLNQADLTLCDFGRLPRLSSGSLFFKSGAQDIFSWIRYLVYYYQTDEEAALNILTGLGAYVDHFRRNYVKGYTIQEMPEGKDINQRIKRANITYNFHYGNLRSNYRQAIKPIRVARFHFLKTNPKYPKPNLVNFFLHGENKLGVQIVPERQVKIFNRHGIK